MLTGMKHLFRVSHTQQGSSKRHIYDKKPSHSEWLPLAAALRDAEQERLKFTSSWFWLLLPFNHGLPRWLNGKESACQCRRCGFGPWVRKIPWRRILATHSSILAWEIPWTEEPGRLWGHKESDVTEHTRPFNLMFNNLSRAETVLNMWICILLVLLIQKWPRVLQSNASLGWSFPEQMELLSKNNLLGHVHTRPIHQDPGREDAEAFEKAHSLKCGRVIFHWQYMQGKQSPKLQQAAFIWYPAELLKSNVLMTNLGILSKCRFWLSRSGMGPEICLLNKLLSGA